MKKFFIFFNIIILVTFFQPKSSLTYITSYAFNDDNNTVINNTLDNEDSSNDDTSDESDADSSTTDTDDTSSNDDESSDDTDTSDSSEGNEDSNDKSGDTNSSEDEASDDPSDDSESSEDEESSNDSSDDTNSNDDESSNDNSDNTDSSGDESSDDDNSNDNTGEKESSEGDNPDDNSDNSDSSVDENLDDNIEGLSEDEMKINDEIIEEISPKIKFDYNSIKIKPWIKPESVYLTFDDGPSYLTLKVLDVLKKYDIKATFFVCGNSSDFGRKVLKRIIKEGHSIGNHTYTHNYEYLYSSEENFFKDFYKNEKLIYNSTGVKTNLVRLPGGSNNQVSIRFGGESIMSKINKLLSLKGYSYFDWNTSSGDAARPAGTKDHIIYNVLNNASKNRNPIVLMHDTSSKVNTLKALPIIIEKLKEFGYDFKKIEEDSINSKFYTDVNITLDKKVFKNTPKLIKY